MKSFECVSYGKWILCGEHAVLRNNSALVFPIYSKEISLLYQETPNDLEIKGEGKYGEHYRLLFLSTYEKALEILNQPPLKGDVFLKGNLPVGSGLGSSASISVLVGKFFHFLGLVKKNQLFHFCKSLEDIFHGESSGVDVAVNLEQKPIWFQKTDTDPIIETLKLKWKPTWCLSFSGKMGFTLESIEKVKQFFKTNPEKAHLLDSQMEESVLEAKRAICFLQQEEGLEVLRKAIEKAYLCFKEWGLITDSLRDYIQQIEEQSPLAFKPTGSGQGGYVLSLWKNSPSEFFKNDDFIEI